jgi:hypothetical protein
VSKQLKYNEDHKQSDIDMMYWQYCTGMVDILNMMLVTDVHKITYLAGGRFAHLKLTYGIFPSFTVSFTLDKTSRIVANKKLV